MVNAEQALVVMCSVPDAATAKQIATLLVETGLAGCVQILPQIQSVYVWEEKVCQETEVLLVIKTLTDNWLSLERQIMELHPYDEPELIGLPATEITAGYANWLRESCNPK